MSARRVAMLGMLALAGCGGGGPGDESDRDPPRVETAPRTVPTERRPRPLEPARCPPAAGNCASATGRVLYVEKVDPDGDGDAHIVIAGGRVTGPGLSVIDVRRDLRPDPLPGPGDQVTASGPVYRGSYGQRQIEATQVRVRRR